MATRAKTTRKKTSRKGTRVLTAAPDTTRFTGQFVEVVSGKHKGLKGAIIQATHMDENGVDDEGILRTRDDDTQRVVVDYKDLELRDQAGR